jgi:carboxyl-terminal processing protease
MGTSMERDPHLVDEEQLTDEVVAPSPYRPRVPHIVRTAAIFALVLVVGFAGGLKVGASGTGAYSLSNIPLIGDSLDPTPDPSADFNAFWKAWNALDARFVETHGSSSAPTTKEKLWGAIAGMTDSFGDPYTVFMPPQEAQAFQETISGEFGGVGMEMGIKDKALTIIAPLKGTPAERAGLMAGDVIIAIDDVSTDGITIDGAVKQIRGKKGTSVVLKIMREGAVLDITVVRDTIAVPTIEHKHDPVTGVFTISIYEFTATSNGLFDKALAAYRASGSRLLIIDVRGNPGGYLSSAVSMASHFLPEGTLIVTEDYKGKEPNSEHRSRGTGGIPEGTKVVVLIDKGSASASEILAGALQDGKIATLVGTRSFGKGSVQELIDIDGGALKVTIARWLTPSGKSISDGGLAPDIEVERTGEDAKAGKDPQMARAVEFLTKGK